MVDLPPRSPALLATPMLMTFDVDCGEVLPGHRFVARGLGGPVLLPLPRVHDDGGASVDGDTFDDEDDDDAVDGGVGDLDGFGPIPYRTPEQVVADVAGGAGYPGFSLEYELVPGLPPEPEGWSFFDALVGLWFDADVPLPWEPSDGGAIAPFEGGMSTHGSRGDWPLPPDARVLTFTLVAAPAARPELDEPPVLGRLVVDLGTEEVRWEPEDAASS